MLGRISICLRKRVPLASVMNLILLVQMLQLQSQSVLICLVDVTLTANSILNILQFARRTAPAIYYTAVGLEKCNTKRTDREPTENRQTEKAITEATLLLIDRRVEWANNLIKYSLPPHSMQNLNAEY